ncbi:MAG TPA: TrkH family potassium uptake protein [Balneolaceae bacterium]|nr:TrkH family potassium uptake protein [Balneolaceae bacterium]
MPIFTSSKFKRPTIDFFPVLGLLGLVILFLSLSLLIPIIIALIYDETTWRAFLYAAAIAFILGATLYYLFKPDRELRLREGFLIVSLTWLVLSLIGALPFIFSGVLPSYTDAVFETMSGFTTTGATIFGGVTSSGFTNPNVETLPKSILFWRSLTHWIGGMGIVVLTIAILPLLGVGGMQLFKAESPGPTADKLTPQIQETAKLLWTVYMIITAAEFILLWLHPSMSWFDSLNHTFATVATGGFSTKNNSIQAFNSVYVDAVITIFMFLSGISFAMHFRLLRGDVKSFLKNRETRFYTLITVLSIIVISLSLWAFDNYSIGSAFRYSSFQIVSIITTTGFGTDNFEFWYPLGQFLLFLLFFSGACAGSTAGGPKMIRWLIIIRNSFREFKQTLHPKAILPIRIGDKTVEPETLRSVLSFIALYIITFGLGALAISGFGFDTKTAIGASITCLGNIGPGWGAVGPAEGFAKIPYLGKWILTFLMMIGRLEIFTVLLIFTPSFWKQ